MTAAAELSTRAPARGRGLWVALAVSLTLNIFVIGGLAWSMFAVPPPPAANPAERLIDAANSLNLTAEQHAALGKFAAGARDTTRSMRQANAPLMRDMWTEMGKPTPDEQKLSGLADQALDNRRTYQHQMAANLRSFLATLTLDQRKEFSELAMRRHPVVHH
jgi:Spy/CpxP family protein refolding chaperone